MRDHKFSRRFSVPQTAALPLYLRQFDGASSHHELLFHVFLSHADGQGNSVAQFGQTFQIQIALNLGELGQSD
jgi:hypothetical protein